MEKHDFKRLATRAVAYTALMTALVYVGSLIGFSGAQFYFNLGDTVILVCAALLNPVCAMIAGGLGSFFCDLTVYPATMVFTLIIKGLEGLLAGFLFKLIYKLHAAIIAKSVANSFRDYIASDALSASANGDLPAPSSDGEIETNGNDIDTNDSEIETNESILNNGEIENTTIKNQVFENTTRIKKRAFAIKVTLSSLAAIICTGFMMTGYFVCQTFFYGTYAAALLALPMDAVQASISSVAAMLLLYGCRLEKLRPKLLYCK